jgi:predicted enzyme related to lactoylglutathione lyase
MPRIDAYETGSPCWTDLATIDPDAAVNFYTTVFGWEHDAIPTGNGDPYHMFMQDGAYVAACVRQDADAVGVPRPG